MKKKILFLVNHDIVIYNFRKEIVERFISEGYEVIISSPYGERIEELINMGCKYYEIEMDRQGTNIVRDVKLLTDYYNLIKKVKPNIIFGFTIKPNIYGAFIANKYKIPFVANITGLGTAVENGGLLQKFTVILYKIAFRNVKTVFLQNQENYNFFIKNKIATNKLKLLPGSGVNLKQFSPIKYPPENATEFVFISRIMKQKGIDIYLNAAKQISREYPNTKFHICGFCEEDYEKKLKDYQKEEIIIYHGMLRDIREILKTTHCTVHPTFYPEGLSNILLESAASGRPLITTDRSGTREVINDGENGYLVKPKDVNDLVDKIKKFINLSYDSKITMGIKSRELVEEKFDREIVVDAYLKELNVY